MKNFAAAHKKGCFLFLCIFLVFLGCFSFPAINLTKHFPPQISLLNLLSSCLATTRWDRWRQLYLHKRSAANLSCSPLS